MFKLKGGLDNTKFDYVANALNFIMCQNSDPFIAQRHTAYMKNKRLKERGELSISDNLIKDNNEDT